MKNSIFSLMLLTLLISSCKQNEKQALASQPSDFCLDDQLQKDLNIVQPGKKTIEEPISLTGAVEANPDKVVHFTSLVNGIVSATYFSLGDKVTKGQVLAELRSTELSSLQSELSSLSSQIQVAEQKKKSVQSMFDDGIASQKELSEAQSELDILRSQRQKVTADLSLYSASAGKGVFQIKAPASGIVTAKTVSAGTQITSEGEPLFTISNLNEVWVTVNVYASNIRNIQQGMPVEIKTLSYPGETFTGKIAAISQALDEEARVLKARVVLPNPGFRLKPGMLVDVMALKQQLVEAITVPTAALVFDNNQHYVVVQKDRCNIEARQVEVLANHNGTTFLHSTLSESDKIISKNHLLIYEQLKNFQK
ncbi:efflux RND transporter periplasmic adaptor subunit [Aridibaculum aurantiacum]|uniref:efflux RND transporter periplasmic adaptor subunit n=1 Tax=Aridibaculum aurantiacum TaxID=2810307 RepID=UPI001A97BDB4|nr:efflux RND transporter periplasmic adaptor subunit [Aridibaculum aurantiacum]